MNEITMQLQLEEAIRREDYELAATLRDQLAAGYSQPLPAAYPSPQPSRWFPWFEPFFSKEEWAQQQQEAVNHLMQAERLKNIEHYNQLKEQYHSQLLANEQAKITDLIARSKPAIHAELLRRIKSLFPKKNAAYIAKNIIPIIDHRDNSTRYLAQGKLILQVNYSPSGLSISPDCP